MPPRIFVSGLHHEGHSFSTLLTERESFAIVRGDALLEKAATSKSSLGGAYRRLAQAGAAVAPGLFAIAAPGGPVRQEAYVAMRDEIVARAVEARPDGVYLDLHGAMVTGRTDDVEGDLLGALRRALGEAVPLSISLDLHAHVTPAMLGATDICIACKENPHSDYDLAGERAAALLLDRLRGTRFTQVAAWLPLILAGRIETGSGPLARVHALRRQLETSEPDIADLSVYNTTAFLDASGAGQCVTALTRGDPSTAAAAVTKLATALWEERHAFADPGFPALDAIFEDVARHSPCRRPTIIGDQGDRVLAGAPGDSTYVIERLLRHWPQLRAVVPLTDPAAVIRAHAAGIAGRFEGPIGGAYSVGTKPVSASWTVAAVGDGRFVQHGPYLAGEVAEMGPTAILRSGNLMVLATSRPGYTQDRAAFTSQGVAFDGLDAVVSKSGFHFKLSFADIGPCVVADTPGLTNYRPGLLPYRRRGPCFPEAEVGLRGLVTRQFVRI